MTEQEKLILRCYKMSYLIGYTAGTLIEIINNRDQPNIPIPPEIKATLNALINKLISGFDELDNKNGCKDE